MRLFFAIAIGLFAQPTYAQQILHLSHLQHRYGGGGGCIERFWFEWESWGSEISLKDIELSIEIVSNNNERMKETLRLERLGTHSMDNSDEVAIETPQCFSGRPRLIVQSATATIGGKRIDLLKKKILRLGKIERFSLSISGPTHHPKNRN